MTGLRPASPALTPTASLNIEWLRLFLVAQVLFGHLALITLPPFGQLDLHHATGLSVAAFRFVTRFGQQAAYAFVFLSGYFLVPRLIDLARSRRGEITASGFLLRRLQRIYPTLVAAVILTLLCDEIGIRLLGAGEVYSTRFSYDPVTALNPIALLGNLLSLQPTFVSAFGSNGPLWTLGYLVQFYVIGTLLALGARDHPRATLAGAAVLAIMAAVLRPEWLMLFLAWLLAGLVRRVAPYRRSLWLLVPSLVLLVLANRVAPIGSIVLSTAAVILAVLAVRDPTLVPDRGTPPTLAVFSRLSYAIYAFHMPVSLLVYALLRRLLGMDHWLGWAIFITVAPAIVIFAAFGWERVRDWRVMQSRRA